MRDIHLDNAVGEFSEADEEEHANVPSMQNGVRRGSSEESLLLDGGELAFNDQYYVVTFD